MMDKIWVYWEMGVAANTKAMFMKSVILRIYLIGGVYQERAAFLWWDFSFPLGRTSASWWHMS